MELTQQQAFFSALEARLTAAGAECFPEPGAGAPQLGDGLVFPCRWARTSTLPWWS